MQLLKAKIMNASKKGKWVMLMLLFLSFFSVNYAQFLLLSFSDEFMEDFGILTVQFTAVTFSFTISAGIIGMSGGMLADRFGSSRIMAFFGVISAAAALLRVASTSYWVFFLCCILTGALFGGSLAVNGKIVRAWFPVHQLGTAFSIVTTGSAVSVVCAMLSITWYRSYRQALIVSSVFIVITAVLWILFGTDAPAGVEIEKSPSVIRNLPAIFQIKGFWSVTTGSVIFTALMFAMSSKLAFVLFELRGMDQVTANRIASIFNIFISISAYLLPLVQRKLGCFRPMMMVLSASGLVWLITLAVCGTPMVVPSIILFGFSIGVISGFFSTILARLPGMKNEYLGSAMGIGVMLRYIAGVFILVPFVVTPLMEIRTGYLYVSIGVFCIMIFICSWIMPETGTRP